MAWPRQVGRALRHPVRFLAIVKTVMVWLEIYFATQAEIEEARAEVIEVAIDSRIAPDEEAIYPYLFACVYILFVGWYLMDRLPVAEYRKARTAFLT